MKNKFLIVILLLLNNVALTEANHNKIFKYSIIQHDNPKTLNDIEFFDADGNKHILDSYLGQPIIIQFWASWCTFCIDNIKELDNLYKTFKYQKKENTLHIITLSEDYKDPITIKNLFDNKKIEYLQPFIDKGNSIFNNLKISSIPSTIILDKDGKEVIRINGFINWTKDTNFLEIFSKYL